MLRQRSESSASLSPLESYVVISGDENSPKSRVGLDERRLDSKGALSVLDSLLVVADRTPSGGSVGEVDGVTAVDSDGLVVLGNGVGVLFLGHEGITRSLERLGLSLLVGREGDSRGRSGSGGGGSSRLSEQ